MREDACKSLGEKAMPGKVSKVETPKNKRSENSISLIVDHMKTKHTDLLALEDRKLELEERKQQHAESNAVFELERRKVGMKERELECQLKTEKEEAAAKR